MNAIGLAKYAGALAALAICSACGTLAVAPTNSALSGTYVGRTLIVNGRPVTAARLSTSPLPRYATILPDFHRKPRTHEYIINDYGSYAAIFNYPKSDNQIGQINGAGGQGCTNVLFGYGKKIFWNVGGPTQITEYRVPQRPIKTLTVNYHFPSSCAMNTSGDLAVGILYATSSYTGGGEVVIFKNATGTPKVYKTPLDQEFFDGYDGQGNLFADGFTGNRSGFALVELPKGAKKFVTISTSNAVGFPGSVQWDGTYLTVVDQNAAAMYQYTVSGTKATLKGTVSLTGSGDCAQTWIGKGLVFCADAGNTDGEVYKYPAGGSALAVLGSGLPLPLGTTAADKY